MIIWPLWAAVSPCIDRGTFLGVVSNTSSLPPKDEAYSWDIQGTPRYGKWPGDKPDIGAYEWIPSELQTTNGLWNGKVLTYNPLRTRPKPPIKLRIK